MSRVSVNLQELSAKGPFFQRKIDQNHWRIHVLDRQHPLLPHLQMSPAGASATPRWMPFESETLLNWTSLLFPPAKEIVKQHLGHLGLRSFEELLAVCTQHNVPVWPAWFLPRVAKEWRSISELCEARTGPSSWPVTSEVLSLSQAENRSCLAKSSCRTKQKGEIRSLLGGLVSLPPSLPKCLQVWKPSDPIRRWSLTQIAEKFVRVAGEEHRSTHRWRFLGIRPKASLCSILDAKPLKRVLDGSSSFDFSAPRRTVRQRRSPGGPQFVCFKTNSKFPKSLEPMDVGSSKASDPDITPAKRLKTFLRTCLRKECADSSIAQFQLAKLGIIWIRHHILQKPSEKFKDLCRPSFCIQHKPFKLACIPHCDIAITHGCISHGSFDGTGLTKPSQRLQSLHTFSHNVRSIPK